MTNVAIVLGWDSVYGLWSVFIHLAVSAHFGADGGAKETRDGLGRHILAGTPERFERLLEVNLLYLVDPT